MPVAADYDGDGKSDVAVYRSTTGQWFINQSKSGALSTSWGSPELLDLPVPGDYDGDNRKDVAVFRRTSGEWLIRLSTTGQQKKVHWGATGNDDAPVPGDYDGNGVTDIAVFRRSTGQWFVLFDNQTTATWNWGSSGYVDVPVPADYDGDGTTDIGVFRQTTGTWVVHLSQTNGTRTATWGAPALGDVPVPADYDGDGSADFVVFRSSTGEWHLSYAKGGSATFSWGSPTAGDTIGGFREAAYVAAWVSPLERLTTRARANRARVFARSRLRNRIAELEEQLRVPGASSRLRRIDRDPADASVQAGAALTWTRPTAWAPETALGIIRTRDSV